MLESILVELQLAHDGYAAHPLRDPVRMPHTLPEVEAGRPTSREISARVRRIEDSWARHANDANGFGAGESVSWLGMS